MTGPALETLLMPRLDIAAQKQRFLEDGYVVLRDVIAKELLSGLRTRVQAEFERARAAGDLFSGGGLMSGHINCFPGKESRQIYDTLQERGIIDLVKSITPQAERLPNVGCNFNLPGSVRQHYHTDWPFRREFLIVNVAVVDTDLQNGAIDLLPGTHKEYLPYWRFVAQRTQRATTRIPMNQGDVLVRTSNLWHRGMPNQTTTPRPMVAFTWEDGGSTEPDPFAVEGGRIAFRPNWFRPTRLGRLREQTFVSAPFTYDAYRIVDSLLTKKGF